MKTLLTLALVSVAIATFAEEPIKQKAKPTEAEMQEKAMKKFGGFVVQPGTKNGSIGFINAQKRLPVTEIDKAVTGLHEMLKHEILVKEAQVKGLPTRADVAKAGVSLAVFAVDDPALPVVLAAPEERWALVNVAKLNEGLKDDVLAKGLVKHRFRGELHRAFALVAGAWMSQYQGNMNSVSSLKELDSVKVDDVTVDVMMRCEGYLKSINVTPERVTTYHRAYREGWAPAPTNEYQKAIVEKINALRKK